MGHVRDRILIMPAGRFQVPAIQNARRMGIEVLAIDRAPGAEGLHSADFAEVVDPVNVDQTIRVARKYKVNGVVSLANDPSTVPCALVAEALHLPGLAPEAARCTRNKLLMRRKLRELLPQYCPGFSEIGSPADVGAVKQKVGFPAVLKPADGHGSKGVICVDSEHELEAAYRYALPFSAEKTVIAEERLDGREVSVESITVDGATHVVAVTDKLTTPPPFCAETGHTVPSALSTAELDTIETSVQRVIDAFEIDFGAAHTELYLTGRQVRIVEIGARLGGGCIASHLVPLATGVDMMKAVFEMALGRVPQLERTRHAAAAIRFMLPAPGRVISVSGLDEARNMPGVAEVRVDVGPGDMVRPLENSDHRTGYVIAADSDRARAAVRAEQAVAAVCIQCADTV